MCAGASPALDLIVIGSDSWSFYVLRTSIKMTKSVCWFHLSALVWAHYSLCSVVHNKLVVVGYGSRVEVIPLPTSSAPLHVTHVTQSHVVYVSQQYSNYSNIFEMGFE